MAINAADSVKVEWTGTGAGTPITLGAAVPGFQAVPSTLNGFIVSYLIEHKGSGVFERENGHGTYTHSGTTLTRSDVTFSTNSNAPVNFSAGTKHISIVLLSDDLDEMATAGNIEVTAYGTLIAGDVQVSLENLDDAFGNIDLRTDLITTDISTTTHQPTSGTRFKYSNASGVTITLSSTLTEPGICQLEKLSGAGTITITPDAGKTINGSGSSLTLVSRATVWVDGNDYTVQGGTSADKSFDGSNLLSMGAISGNGVANASRSGTAITVADSGKIITTAAAVTIPNTAIGSGWFHATLIIGANTHDFTFNSNVLDISAAGFVAAEMYSVVVLSASTIKIAGPAGTFDQTDFL